MNLLDIVKTGFAMGTGRLPSVQPSKLPSKPVALGSFKTQLTRSESAIPRTDRGLANRDITRYRTSGDTRTVVRDLAASNPDLNGTKSSYLRVGIPETYTVVARDMDGAINPESTKLAQEILRRVTFLGDPSLGYNPVTDLQSLSESLGMELIYYGAAGLELSLDKFKAPLWFSAVSVTKIQWKEEEGGVFPEQVIGGERRPLDIPTFFYVSVDQDLLTPYSTSYFESAIQAVIADTQFMNNLRSAMQRALNPRMVAEIVEEKFKSSCPPEIANDPDKYAAFCSTTLGAINDLLSTLNPDDAITTFDSVKYTVLAGSGSSSMSDTLSTVQKLLESKVAAGAKTMPAVMGRGDSGAATTTAMLFLKNADMVRRKLNTLYSRALTQACRIMGDDVFVEFTYAELDLRPSGELEAYKSMKQSRIIALLSLGMISDVEACIELTGNLPPDGYKDLAGTMFANGGATAIINPQSQTSTMNGGKDTLKPQTPAAPKGKP